MNEILDIKLIQLYSSYVNNKTDMHAIYYITSWLIGFILTCNLSDIVCGFCCAVCKDRSRDYKIYNDRQCGSDVNWDFNLWLWVQHVSDQAII